jgi:hypothetical protein
MKNLIKIAPEVFVRSDEVVSVERDTTYKYSSSSPSDYCLLKDFDGSRVILKNGRKVYVRGVFPAEILKMLEKECESN